MIVIWKNGVRNEMTELSWKLLVNKNGWEREKKITDVEEMPIEVEEILTQHVDLYKLSHTQLKELCAERGISYKGNLGVAKLIALLDAN